LLPTYDAFRLVRPIGNGRTRPLLIECESTDDSGVPISEFVVKAPGLPEVEDYGLFAECLGYLLAPEFDVVVSQPALIRITDDFVHAVNPVLRSEGLSLKAGIGFGSEYLGSGLVPVSADMTLDAEQLSAAFNLYCYDLLIQNPDRLERNPNCLVKEGRIIAFDFNLAFTFLMLIGGNDEPWKVSEHQKKVSEHQKLEKHLFYRALKGKALEFKPFITRVERFSPERLADMLAVIPFGDGRWDAKVNDHFSALIEHSADLELELARSLV